MASTSSTDDDDHTPGPYQTAAPMYYRAGWPTFPVVGKAINIPKGVTGRAGQPIEYATVVDWMVSRPDDNIAVRLTGVIGIDVDAYAKDDVVKRGDETLHSAEHLWGALPPTWRSTSREPGNPSGIRFYRVPKGLEFRTILSLPNADGEATGDIEIIQHSHRYAVVWPSVHPDTGTTYRWYTPGGQVSLGVPDALELPVLPARWVDELTLIRPTAEERPPAPVAAQLALPADWHPRVTEHYQDGLTACTGPAGSRHDNTLVVVGQLARDESLGRAGATTALGLLRERFVAAIGPDGQRDPAREFEGMLESSRTMVATTVSTLEAERAAILAVFANVPEVAERPPVPAGPQPAAELGPVDDLWASFGAWRPVDVSKYLDDGWEPDPPDLLMRTDGKGLYYRRNVNWLHGASGEGKTWVALVTVAQEIQAGRDVLWIHYEDPEADKITHRLSLLGVPRAAIIERFHVVLVGAESMAKGIPFIRALTSHFCADLVVIDSIGEAIGADGIALKDDDRLVKWLHDTARVIAADGNTVIGIDHLPMGEPSRLDPVGSFRKKAATTGAMYLAQSPKAPTKGKAGYITLTCAKDRSGTWTKGEVVALIHIRPTEGGGTSAEVVPPKHRGPGPETESEILRAAKAAVKAVQIRQGEPYNRGQLESVIHQLQMAADKKRKGIDYATAVGWLVEDRGTKNARSYTVGDLSTFETETAPPVEDGEDEC